MSVAEDYEIANVLRSIEPTGDPHLDERVKTWAARPSDRVEARDVFTVVRIMVFQQRQIRALQEYNKIKDDELHQCSRDIADLKAAQAPEALEARLRTLEGRRLGATPIEQIQHINDTINRLETLKREAEGKILQGVAVEVQGHMLDLRDAVGHLQVQVAQLQQSLTRQEAS